MLLMHSTQRADTAEKRFQTEQNKNQGLNRDLVEERNRNSKLSSKVASLCEEKFAFERAKKAAQESLERFLQLPTPATPQDFISLSDDEEVEPI
jgi:hypothetical protein